MANKVMETAAYAVILPDRLNVLDGKVREAYASIPKSGVAFAQSERKALNNFLFSSFRDKDIPKLILHSLKEAIKKEDESLNGLDGLLEQGAQVYDIPEITDGNGKMISPNEEKYDRIDILAQGIAESQGYDLSTCSAEKFRAYKKEAERFVREAMRAESLKRLQSAGKAQ